MPYHTMPCYAMPYHTMPCLHSSIDIDRLTADCDYDHICVRFFDPSCSYLILFSHTHHLPPSFPQLSSQLLPSYLPTFFVLLIQPSVSSLGNDDRYVSNVQDVRYSLFESLIRSLGSRRLELHRKFPKAESLKVAIPSSSYSLFLLILLKPFFLSSLPLLRN